jgi:hypothetical protein
MDTTPMVTSLVAFDWRFGGAPNGRSNLTSMTAVHGPVRRRVQFGRAEREKTTCEDIFIWNSERESKPQQTVPHKQHPSLDPHL